MLAGTRGALNKGWQTGSKLIKGEFGNTVLPITGTSRDYYVDLKSKGITARETPLQFAGALGAKLLTDIGTDGTRNQYWRYNHPSPVTQTLYEKIAGPGLAGYSQPQKAAIALGAIGIPVGASLGTFDITNIGELGRPKGFAQSYAEQGSEDRRQTGQVVPELIDRFALGRQGRPLKFETAKEDIPDLTKQRYSNYQNFLYNEKGPLGIGIIKGTMENLQGEPELRLAGFPIGLQAAGAALGGTLGVKAATMGNPITERKGDQQIIKRPGSVMPARKVVAMGAAGALAGGLTGKLINMSIARAARKDLPTTREYGVTAERNLSGSGPNFYPIGRDGKTIYDAETGIEIAQLG